MPAILDSLFHKVVNTTSIPIGVEGGGGGEPRKGGKFRCENFLWPNGFNSGCFQLHTSQNVATSMPSLTSQSCGDSLPSTKPEKLEPFTDHPSTDGHQTGR